MRGIARPSPFVCARSLRARSEPSRYFPAYGIRNASNSRSAPEPRKDGEQSQAPRKEEAQGAMSRRLSEMSEESIETGGRGAAKAVEEFGFSEELRNQLLEKIANANFRNENPAAFAQVDMPAGAGKGTRDIAAANPWTGAESTEDATLRMLTDAHKPLRVPSKPPTIRGPRGPPSKVDTGRPKKRPGIGVRLANARDKASSYEAAKEAGLSEEEREEFRKVMKQRFQSGARAMPGTVQGLAALANERIEDAIARGQFKNLPRGKKIERDHNANSAFIDTTEYFMNKMIQKQDIVPPWIEKQQELMSTATRFRSRLRADWKRHVARIISSRGGGLERQVRLAEAYAVAEAVENPPKKKEEKFNAVDNAGHVSQITLAGELKVTPPDAASAGEEDAKVETEIKIVEQSFNDDGTLKSTPDETITVSAEEPAHQAEAVAPEMALRKPNLAPFRDPQWVETERSYLTAAVDQLNSMARSYNLMAPPIARKPYYYLDRELKACFADVAPQIASAIRERALAPKVKGVEVSSHSLRRRRWFICFANM